MIDQAAVGDGSVFDGMPEQAALRDGGLAVAGPGAGGVRAVDRVLAVGAGLVPAALRQRPTLVLVFLGDHQPATVVSGPGADHDVPVTVVAKDPAVLRRIDAWDWQPGLRPSPDAPVWRMDAFRDRFLVRVRTVSGHTEPSGPLPVSWWEVRWPTTRSH